FSNSTLNIALDNASMIVPSCSIEVCLAILKCKVLFYELMRSKHFGSVFENGNSVLIVRRCFPIRGSNGPAIFFLYHIAGAEVDHRLNRYNQSFDQLEAAVLFAVIGNFRRLMKLRPSPVTYQLTDNGKTFCFNVFLDGISYIANPVSINSFFDAQIQG